MGVTFLTALSSPTIETVGANVVDQIYNLALGSSFLNVEYSNPSAQVCNTTFPSFPAINYTREKLVLSKSIGGQTWYYEIYNDIVEFAGRFAPVYFIARVKYRIGKSHTSGTVSQCGPFHFFIADWVYVDYDTDPLLVSPKCTSLSGNNRVVGLIEDADLTSIVSAFEDGAVWNFADGMISSKLDQSESLISNLGLVIPRTVTDLSVYNSSIAYSTEEQLDLGLDTGFTSKDCLMLPSSISGTSELLFTRLPIQTLPRQTAGNPTYIWPIPDMFCKTNLELARNLSRVGSIYHDFSTASRTPGFDLHQDLEDPTKDVIRLTLGMDLLNVTLPDYSVTDPADTLKKKFMWPNIVAGVDYGMFEYVLGRV